MEIKTVNTNNISMNYFSFGNGNKTMVMIPGLSIQSVMELSDLVSDAYNIFSNDYTVYVFDIKDNIEDNYKVKDMALDLIEVFDYLNLKNIYLYGVSLGGMISQYITLFKSDLIKKLCLVSTTSNINDNDYDMFVDLINLAKNKDGSNLCLNFGELIYPKEFFNQNKDNFIAYGKTIKEEAYTKFIKCVEAIKDFNVSNELINIDCPTLVIGDKDDKVFYYTTSENLKDYIGFNAILYLFEGYGHAVYDMSDKFKEVVYDFFEE